jgi:hypothetical protein
MIQHRFTSWQAGFLLNNLSLPWPIDAKLDVAYIKRQLGIATQ